MRVKSLMGLKVWSNLGFPNKILKSSYVWLFLENHTKSNFSIRIPLYANLGFHKKMLFSQICSNGHMRAKRVPRANERASRASEPSSVPANQANQENQEWSLWASKSSVVYAKQANQLNQAWSERAKRASWASLAQFSKIKQIKFKVNFTKEYANLCFRKKIHLPQSLRFALKRK